MDINGWQFLAWLGCGTLALAALAMIAAVVLRLARVSSPAAHRACWICVLGAGWLMFRLPVEVAYHAPASRAQTAIAPAPLPPSPLPPSQLTSATHSTVELAPSAERADLAAAPSSTVASNEEIIELTDLSTGDAPAPESLPLEISTRQEIASATAVATAPIIEIAPSEPPTTTTTKPATAFRPTWTEVARVLWNTPEMLVAMWLAGMAFIALVWLVGYARFVRRLAAHEPVEPQWQQQWQSLALQAGVRRRIPMLVTRELGPLLCRLPRGYALIVPAELWEELDEASRGAILRHELAHYLRRDVWKSLAARVLALPHWFNPLAWLAVRRFDEAAEWACDLAASGKGPATDYASTLLRLGQSVNAHAAYAPGAHGRTLAGRIRRLVSGPRHDSRAKRAFLLCVMGALLLATVVRVRLVAQPSPEAADTASKTETATPESAPTIELSDNEAAPVDDKPSAEPADEKPSAAAVDPAVAEERKAALRMLLAAKQAYEAKVKAFELGQLPLDAVVEWSTRWMQAAEGAATEPDAKIAAAGEHLARMESWRDRVKKLFDVSAVGGEPEKLAALDFHVAEAKAHSARLEAEQQRQIEDAAQSDLQRRMYEAAGEAHSKQVSETIRRSKLRYAGKSFDEWRDKLHIDLSPESQTEAIRAMAKFGAHGLGKEATGELVALLASEFPASLKVDERSGDWKSLTALGVLGNFPSIPVEDRTPAVLKALADKLLAMRASAAQIMRSPLLTWPKAEVVPALLAATHDPDPRVQGMATAALARIDHQAPEVQSAILALLKDGGPEEFVRYLEGIRGLMDQRTADEDKLIMSRLVDLAKNRDNRELTLRALEAIEEARANSNSTPLHVALNALAHSADSRVRTVVEQIFNMRPNGFLQASAVESEPAARPHPQPEPAAQAPVKPSERPAPDPFAEAAPAPSTAKKDEPPFELKVMPIEFRQNDNALIEIQVFNPTSQPLHGMQVVVDLREGVKAKQATEGYKRSGNTLSWKFDQTAIPPYGIISIRLNCGIQATPETLGRVTATNVAGESREAPLDFTVLDPDDPEPLSLKVRTLPPPAPVQQPTLAPSEQPSDAPKTGGNAMPRSGGMGGRPSYAQLTPAPTPVVEDEERMLPPPKPRLTSLIPDKPKSTLRYAGQTFAEWAEKLQNDLSTESQKQAIAAMAKFGAHGLGKEATAELVRAMRDHDGSMGERTDTDHLWNEAASAAYAIPQEAAMPVLLQALQSKYAGEQAFACRVIQSKGAIPALLEVAKNDNDARVRGEAAAAAARLDRAATGVSEAILAVLSDSDPEALIGLLRGASSGFVQFTPDELKLIATRLATLLQQSTDREQLIRLIQISAPMAPMSQELQAAIEALTHSKDPMIRNNAIMALSDGFGGMGFFRPSPAPKTEPAKPPTPSKAPSAEPGADGATVAPPEGFPISKGLRYAGQTFNQWQEKLLFELSPAQRTEAIQAMEMFGRHGLGKEATDAIVAAMRDTDTWTIDNSPEGMMKHAAIDAISKIPAAESTPVLVEALASENEFERAFAALVMPSREAIAALLKAAGDPAPEVRAAALTSAARLDHDSPEVLEALRKGLDDPAARVALAAAGGLLGGRTESASDADAALVTRRLTKLIETPDADQISLQLAFGYLEQLGGRAAGAIPALQKLAAEKNQEIDFLQAAAQKTLAKIHREASAAKPEK